MGTKPNPAEMVWEDPPPAWNRRDETGRHYAEVASLLRANPDRWLIVGTWDKATHRLSASSLASNINHDRLPAFRGPEFEAVSRAVGDEARVYARYIGTGDES